MDMGILLWNNGVSGKRNTSKYEIKTQDMSLYGGYEFIVFFYRCRVEIILISYFTMPSRGIGKRLSDAIILSFKIFVCII